LHLPYQELDLVDALIDGSQSHIPFYLLTPSLTDDSQTLAHTRAKKDILIQIEPKSLVFFEETKMTKDIVMALLTL
jgi:hypothetical protein